MKDITANTVGSIKPLSSDGLICITKLQLRAGDRGTYKQGGHVYQAFYKSGFFGNKACKACAFFDKAAYDRDANGKLCEDIKCSGIIFKRLKPMDERRRAYGLERLQTAIDTAQKELDKLKVADSYVED